MGEKEMTVSQLGRYEVIRQLGKGAMGVVYLGRDPVIGRLVALKTIRIGASTDEDEAREFQERFVREAQAAGILNHPAIVTVHDIGQDAELDCSFIAMEYVEGRNLKELVNRHEVPPYADLCEILSQVADALDYAHSKGIVHRDVKSANIIVCEATKAKITDFGIAKIASHSSNLTSTGQFLGTPNYMAPEQVKGTPVDGRTDLFSFGIVLYEALTGKKPFGGDSLTSISYKIVHEAFPPARSLNPQIPRGFEHILSKCMAKEPSLRYQRGRELATELRKLGDSLSTSEKPTIVGSLPTSSDANVREVDPAATREIPRDFDIDEPTPIDEPPPVFDELPGDISDSARRLAGKARDELLKAVRRAKPSNGLKTPVPIWAGVALGVVLLAWLAWWGLSIRRQTLEPPVEDTALASVLSERRALADEADRLFTRGELETALDKYMELKRLSPENQWVDESIAEIEHELRATELDRRRRTVARGKFRVAMQFYEEGDYESAIPQCQEAFSLDANMPDNPGSFLRASSEKLALQELVGKKVVIPPPDKAGLVIRFNNNTVADGYIAISSNRRTVVKENLWQVRGGFVERRVASSVHLYRTVNPGVTTLVVEVRMPTLNVRESRSFKVMLAEANLYNIGVAFDRMARELTVKLTSDGEPVEEFVEPLPATEE